MRPRARRSLLGLAVGALVALVLVGLRGTWPAQSLELKTLDWRFRALADPARADSDIVIVDVDNLSLDLLRGRLGRYPWRRSAWVPVLEFLRIGGARAIAFDFTFPDPDLEHPAADDSFAAAERAAGNVIQTVFFQAFADSAEARRQARFREDTAGIRRLDAFAYPVAGVPGAAGYPMAEAPYPALLAAARALGAINFTPDPVDGTARRSPLFFDFRGRAFPALGLAVAMAADSARFAGAAPRWAPGALRFARVTVPQDRGALLLNWRGPYNDPRRGAHAQTYRIYPVAQLVLSYDQVAAGETPEVPLDAFRGKVVLIGSSGAGLFDARANPFGPSDPGVLIHATLADNLLTGDFLRRASPAANVAAVVLAALLAGVAASFIGSVWWSVAAGVALAAAYLGLALALFGGGGGSRVWLDAAAPTLAVLLTFTGGMVVNYFTEGRHKRQIREMFSKYVAPEYVAQLTEDPSKLDVGGRRAELTILFSDIRGFTSISEKLEPHEVIAFLNEYLSLMAGIVKERGGTLDKFIGDAVMAFWGEPVHHPDHADRACDCALAMQATTAQLAARWVAEGKPDIHIGVGINTAEVVVGNIGSVEHKLDYTVIGDGVNLASRLESANKEFHTGIIISEFTLARLGGRFDVRPLGDVKVKGKERPVTIYELLGRRAPVEAAPAAAAEVAT